MERHHTQDPENGEDSKLLSRSIKSSNLKDRSCANAMDFMRFLKICSPVGSARKKFFTTAGDLLGVVLFSRDLLAKIVAFREPAVVTRVSSSPLLPSLPSLLAVAKILRRD